jgi:uncharacterized membrane protein YbhN (UPF0104 family)
VPATAKSTMGRLPARHSMEGTPHESKFERNHRPRSAAELKPPEAEFRTSGRNSRRQTGHSAPQLSQKNPTRVDEPGTGIARLRSSPSPRSSGITPPRRQKGQQRLSCNTRARVSGSIRLTCGEHSTAEVRRGLAGSAFPSGARQLLRKRGRMTASFSSRTIRSRGRVGNRLRTGRRLILEPFLNVDRGPANHGIHSAGTKHTLAFGNRQGFFNCTFAADYLEIRSKGIKGLDLRFLRAAIQQLKRYCAWLRGPVALLLGYWRAAIQQLKRNWTWLKWPVALLLLVYLFYSNRQALANLAQRPIDWFYLVVAFVLCTAAMMLTFYRWYLLVWAQDFPFTVRDALRLGFIGYLCGYVAPGSAGGDLVKAAMIAAEQTSRKGVAAATVLLDRILGVLALFMVGAFATFFQDPRVLQNGTVRTCVALLWAGSAGGIVGLIVMLHPAFPRSNLLRRLIRLPKVGNLIGGLVNAVLLYQQRRAVLIMTVLISIVGHFGTLSSFYYCALAINAGDAAPGYWTQLLLIPIAELFAFVIPVPGGIGVLEFAIGYYYVVAFKALGVAGVTVEQASGAGIGAAFANRLATVVVVAIGASYYMMARADIGRALGTSESSPPVTQQPQ